MIYKLSFSLEVMKGSQSFPLVQESTFFLISVTLKELTETTKNIYPWIIFYPCFLLLQIQQILNLAMRQ